MNFFLIFLSILPAQCWAP